MWLCSGWFYNKNKQHLGGKLVVSGNHLPEIAKLIYGTLGVDSVMVKSFSIVYNPDTRKDETVLCPYYTDYTTTCMFKESNKSDGVNDDDTDTCEAEQTGGSKFFDSPVVPPPTPPTPPSPPPVIPIKEKKEKKVKIEWKPKVKEQKVEKISKKISETSEEKATRIAEQRKKEKQAKAEEIERKRVYSMKNKACAEKAYDPRIYSSDTAKELLSRVKVDVTKEKVEVL